MGPNVYDTTTVVVFLFFVFFKKPRNLFFYVLLLTLFKCFLPEETEYEYSGSDEEDENRGDDRESR